MFKGYRYICAVQVLLLLAARLVNAEGLTDLYSATVPVAEQANAELHRAAGVGLRDVLVRVSGQSAVVRNPALGNALNDAERYLDQYRYDRNTVVDSDALPWLASLRFSQNAIAQLLRGANLPVWAGNRPILTVRLVLDDGRTRQFVDEQSAPAIALREQAQRRGLMLRFPKEAGALALDDVWQMDTVKLRSETASSGELLLFGRLAQLPGGRWVGAWTLANGQAAIEGQGDNLPAYLAPSFDRVADLVAQQYAAVATNTSSGVTLHVSGIENFNDYAALLAYLKQIGSIKAVSPVQVRGAEIVLQLKLDGSGEQLVRQLALDNRLAPESASEGPSAALFNYRWQAARG